MSVHISSERLRSGNFAWREAVLKSNRVIPGVHKSIALSYKAVGNMDGARKLAAKAIMYEAPWDDDNKEKNWAFWKELNAEETSGACVSSY